MNAPTLVLVLPHRESDRGGLEVRTSPLNLYPPAKDYPPLDHLTKPIKGVAAALEAFGAAYGKQNGTRKLSAAGRARIAAAQRARWAKAGGNSAKTTMPNNAKTKLPTRGACLRLLESELRKRKRRDGRLGRQNRRKLEQLN